MHNDGAHFIQPRCATATRRQALANSVVSADTIYAKSTQLTGSRKQGIKTTAHVCTCCWDWLRRTVKELLDRDQVARVSGAEHFCRRSHADLEDMWCDKRYSSTSVAHGAAVAVLGSVASIPTQDAHAAKYGHARPGQAATEEAHTHTPSRDGGLARHEQAHDDHRTYLLVERDALKVDQPVGG
jgi:hypothetical protein